jgi:hypothetical protein
MVGQGLALDHKRERVTSDYAERHLSCLSKLARGSVNESLFCQRFAGDNRDKHKRNRKGTRLSVSPALVRARESFQAIIKTDIVSGKPNFYL